MPALVFLQGQFLDPASATLSAFDAGLQHAVGLFETMTGAVTPTGSSVTRLEEHLTRLATSARELGLSDSLRTGPLADAVLETLARSQLPRARIRLTVTGGDLNLLERSARTQHEPTVLIAASPATTYPPAMFERGVGVTIADAKANPLDPTAPHKTLNYWWRLRELQRAAQLGAGESIVLQVSNHLAGGCVSNLFLVKDGTLLTPIARGDEDRGAIPSPVLPGTTRSAVIAAAASRSVGCARRMLSVSDLLDADEVFLTNSSWGILPVVKVEAEAIADAVPGPLTTDLRADLTNSDT
jgi:branched-subunit amino acid aminotransferase/4-amino-4-deoxychorismate lyase